MTSPSATTPAAPAPSLLTRSQSDTMARLRVARGVLGLTGTDSSSPFDNLPDREYQVLWYVGHGYSVREIAEHLRVSVPTIETYRSRLKDKLGCDDHTDLLKCAIQWAHSNAAV